VAGLGLGIVLALLVELLNRPMRSPNQVNAMGLPVLGVVPILQTSSRKKRFRIFKKKRASRFA
jgi:capsular polysaccharide biosynthesis protein